MDLFYENIRKEKPQVKLADYFYSAGDVEDKSATIKHSSTNDEVLSYLKSEASRALDRTFKILRTRVDQFGVTQPNIIQDVNSGRIVVELPGAADEKRVRDLLKKSAKLEFYETYKAVDLRNYILEADKAYMDYLVTEGVKKGDHDAIVKMQKDSIDRLKIDSLDKQIAAVAATDTAKKKELQAKKTKLTAKKDNAGDHKIAELLHVGELRGTDATIGKVKIGDTTKVNSILNLPSIKAVFPSDFIPMWEAKVDQDDKTKVQLVAIKSTGLKGKEAVLGGDVIKDARHDIDPKTSMNIVSMQMNPEGATEWASITRKNVNKNVAIVLDNQVYSAPNVQNEIDGGSSQIQGNFNVEEAKDLANILTAGRLPVELDIVDQAVIGPSLGQASINKGLLSLLIGLIAIVVFMVAYYNRGGWVANITVIINLFFIIGVLTSLQAALTLPGIAGIVLTLAMAVDANVLIYERIREELNHGKGMRLAISDGYKHALSSILDGNITTLLIGIILMAFGTGPVYGFAVVLVIGILTSLFCAILISRIIFDWLLIKERAVNFGNKVTYNLLRNINFDFVGNRKIGYWFSGITLAIAIFSLATRGLNYGVEFKGGRAYAVEFKGAKTATPETVRTDLTAAFKRAPEVKTYGSANVLEITTDYLIEKSDVADSQVRSVLTNTLKSAGYDATVIRTSKVGSTIASDIKQSAFRSIIFGLLVVFLYIIIRFKRWQFALGATLALAHDSIFVLGLFSIFKDILPFMDVDQAIVAAILTVIGYSVNDTVVVFDRIREYLRNNKKSKMIPTVNDAINHTLNRTVITSLTIVIVVAILFIFGGHILRGFSFAMLIGVIVGTYSSIFVATPIAVDLHTKEQLDSVTGL